MKIRALGCSGGIGASVATTSYIIDSDILIDAGTGVGRLTLDEMTAIDHIFLTHSHLDHINSFPLLADSVGMLRENLIHVYSNPDTIAAIREHIMNGQVWPDFSIIPDPENPFIQFHEMDPGSSIELNGRTIRSVPMSHTVPAVGYFLGEGGSWMAFSGDTTTTDEFWRLANNTKNLRYIIIETTFTDEQSEIARVSGHLCPAMLKDELDKLDPGPEVFLTHLMPGSEQQILDQVAQHVPVNTPKPVMPDQIFNI